MKIISFSAFLILSIASLVYSCYSTYVFQAGLTSIIYKQFRVPVLITLTYIVLSITLHVTFLSEGPDSTKKWPKVLNIIQKLGEHVVLKVWKFPLKNSNFYLFSLSCELLLFQKKCSDNKWPEVLRKLWVD